MKKGLKIALIVLACIAVLIALKIFLHLSWWVVLSPVWFPIAFAYGFIADTTIVTIIGKRLQKKKDAEEAKIPHTCDNCLFGKSSELIGEGSCLGEKMGANRENGTCEHFVLSRTATKSK